MCGIILSERRFLEANSHAPLLQASLIRSSPSFDFVAMVERDTWLGAKQIKMRGCKWRLGEDERFRRLRNEEEEETEATVNPRK